jgi:alpha-L-fucosidase 2
LYQGRGLGNTGWGYGLLIQFLSMRKSIFVLAMAAAGTVSAAALDQKDVEYARPDGKRVLLDLHVPDGAGPFPAAILIHGGGFDEGSKSTNVRPLFDVLAGAGYAWFSIDYRMAPEFRFPQAIEDVNSAIKWVKANASTYRVDMAKIALIGESAGGFLVNYAGTHETPETRVRAVVDLYGPVDYGKLAEERRDHPERFNMTSINRHASNGGGIHFFGAEQLDAAGLAKLHGISPIFAVHKGMAPFLCIHGTKDDQVSFGQSPAMCEAMKKVGAGCELIPIEGGGHGMSGWRAPELQHWKEEMLAWLKKTMN